MAGAVTADKRKKTQQSQKDAQKATAAASIEKVTITANGGKSNKRGRDTSKSADVASGVINLKYYESLLQDHVVVELTFADSGGGMDNKSVVDGLPVENECNVDLKIKDTQGEILDFRTSKNNSFKVEKVTNIGDDATKSVVSLQLITTEAVKNNYSGVEIRKDGKISEHVKRILKDKEYLNSKKKLNIDETANNLNYCFAKNKPFFVINRIAKDAVPQGADGSSGSKLGKSAGFLFYETYEGYYFRGIDTLFGQEHKIKVIYNNTPGTTIPDNYDAKALTYHKEGTPSLTKKLQAGFQNTKITQFNPLTMEYKVSSFNAEDMEESLTLAGKEFPALNQEFNNQELNKNYSRSTFIVDMPGVLPTGDGTGDKQEQLGDKSKELNFDSASILNQSIMRYNQMFFQKVTITIPGDFSLHAGDAIRIDTVEHKETENQSCGDDVDKKNGGKYIISTLCHYLTPDNTYTKLVLIRDSVGRTPSKGGGTTDFHGSKVPKGSGGNII